MPASPMKDKLLALLDADELYPGDIRLDAKGLWHIKTETVTDRTGAILLSRLLVESLGQYILIVDEKKIPVTVEDVPLFITELRTRGTTNHEDFFLTLSNGTTELLDFETLYFNTVTRSLYCTTGNGMKARFEMIPSINFLDRLDEDDNGFFLFINGERKEIPRR